MPSVADCLRQHGESDLQEFGDAVSLGHRRVLSAITRCRTGELGSILYQCGECGREHWVGRSCGNRHCPGCQHEKTSAWLEKQIDRLLPVHHFLVTFTVPQEVRSLLRAHQKDTPSKSKTSKTRTVTGHEFVRGFVQHVLPRGYQKVRYYGWMSANSGISRDSLRWLVWLYLGWTYWLGSGVAPQPTRLRPEPVHCQHCGSAMRIVAIVDSNGDVLFNHSLSYLDSGLDR